MKRSMMAGFALCAFGAFGAIRTNTLEKTATDWTLQESYVDKSFVPGDGDVVIVPVGADISLAVPSDSFAKVANVLGKLCFQDTGATVTVTVAESNDVTFLPLIERAPSSKARGLFVKKGAGAMTIGDGASFPSGQDVTFNANFRIAEGTLRAVQNMATGKNLAYGAVDVAAGATFVTHGGNAMFTSVHSLTGAGRVTTPNAAISVQLRITGPDDNAGFSGVIESTVKPYVDGRLLLTGTASTFSNQYKVMVAFNGGSNFVNGAGVVGVRKFGLKNDARSSIGLVDTITFETTGGCYRYLGGQDGVETTDKTFWWNNDSANGTVCALDGGPYGNLKMTGLWKGNKAGDANIFLVGTNADECVMHGTIDTWASPVRITKAGSGAWRFTDRAGGLNATQYRKNDGVIAVEEGTLRFDSLEEAGYGCSLGYATKCADYAFLLGATATSSLYGRASEGTLEYANSSDGLTDSGVYCTTRRIALKGDGRIRNASARRMTLRDVVSRGANAKTLTLQGSAALTNCLADVVDTDGGAISIVKEGADTWTLTGTNAIRGTIAVKSGKLILHNVNAQKYTWHKWVIRDNWAGEYAPTGDQSKSIRINEFGLFDANGVRVNAGLAYQPDFASLEPGEAAFSSPALAHYGYMTDTEKMALWFDGVNNGNSHTFCTEYRRVSGAQAIDANDPKTWREYTMRLEADAGEAVSWDYAGLFSVGSGANRGMNPRSSSLYASANGVNWEPVAVVDDVPVNAKDYGWVFDGRAAASGHTNCNVIASSVQGAYPFLPEVGAVSVAAGAVLEATGAVVTLSKIKVDAADCGQFRNIAFASKGTLEVENLPDRGDLSLPGVFAGCAGRENLGDWTLTAGDKELNRDIRVTVAGDLQILRRGLMLILR